MSIDIRFVFACMFVMKTSSDSLDLKLNARWNSANIHTDPGCIATSFCGPSHGKKICRLWRCACMNWQCLGSDYLLISNCKQSPYWFVIWLPGVGPLSLFFFLVCFNFFKSLQNNFLNLVCNVLIGSWLHKSTTVLTIIWVHCLS